MYEIEESCITGIGSNYGSRYAKWLWRREACRNNSGDTGSRKC